MKHEILNEAIRMKGEIARFRRYIHKTAEVGENLPRTMKFIEATLLDMGIPTEHVGDGIVGTVGDGDGACMLLRADCDALPIPEKTGLDYAAENGNMHACGHDMHAAMLLGAAKILKMHERELSGKVRLVFQPAEEILSGAKKMIADGLLAGVVPDAAVMVHVVTARDIKPGVAILPTGGNIAPRVEYFKVRVKGIGAHGASPSSGIDSITSAVRILLGFEELSSREFSCGAITLTVGKIHGGNAANAIAECTEFEGTLRSFDDEIFENAKDRMYDICEGISCAFLTKCELEFTNSAPMLRQDDGISEMLKTFLVELLGKENVKSPEAFMGSGSEDFAYIAEKIPSAMIVISAAKNEHSLHHPRVEFDEDVLPIGAAVYAYSAIRLCSEEL